MSHKKKDLIAYKEELLSKIRGYEQQIAEAEEKESSSFEEEESSDSDLDIFPMDISPPISQLMSQHDELETCLLATEELTQLELLQIDVNVLVQSPIFEGEPPITQPGTWREVTAKCYIEGVPFSITFYSHTGEAKFAPVLCRRLKVSVTNTMQEAELANSVMPDLRCPSDAVEVVRNYASAYKSRDSTLAKLSDKFGAAIFTEHMESGGYLLKVANVLEAKWTLQNKWSPIALFHHRLSFDLDYMDESYVKIIEHAHRQLSNPNINMVERTELLDKIISTCLSALTPQPGSSNQDSGDMDSSPVNYRQKRRTTLDREPDQEPEPNRVIKKESEVVAPPESLPEEVKRNNESTSANTIGDPKPTKQSIQENKSNDNIKKPKTAAIKEEYAKAEVNTELTAKNSKSVASVKNEEEKITSNTESGGDKANVNKTKSVTVNKDVAAKIQNSENVKKAGKATIVKKEPANTEIPDENRDKKDEAEAVMNIGAAKNVNTNIVATRARTKRNTETKIPNTENPENSKTSTRRCPNNRKVRDISNLVKHDEKNCKGVKSVSSASSSKTNNYEKPVTRNVKNKKGEAAKTVGKRLANVKTEDAQKVTKENIKEESSNNIKKTNATILQKKIGTRSVINTMDKLPVKKNPMA